MGKRVDREKPSGTLSGSMRAKPASTNLHPTISGERAPGSAMRPAVNSTRFSFYLDTMAHELGHMLLHSGAHAPTGLMKGIWSKTDWQRAAVSVIEFSPAQVQQIAALHERTAAADIAQLASLTPR